MSLLDTWARLHPESCWTERYRIDHELSRRYLRSGLRWPGDQDECDTHVALFGPAGQLVAIKSRRPRNGRWADGSCAEYLLSGNAAGVVFLQDHVRDGATALICSDELAALVAASRLDPARWAPVSGCEPGLAGPWVRGRDVVIAHDRRDVTQRLAQALHAAGAARVLVARFPAPQELTGLPRGEKRWGVVSMLLAHEPQKLEEVLAAAAEAPAGSEHREEAPVNSPDMEALRVAALEAGWSEGEKIHLVAAHGQRQDEGVFSLTKTGLARATKWVEGLSRGRGAKPRRVGVGVRRVRPDGVVSAELVQARLPGDAGDEPMDEPMEDGPDTSLIDLAQVPPGGREQDQQHERALLAALLVYPSESLEAVRETGVTPEHFYLGPGGTNGRVFAAELLLAERGELDAITLAAELVRLGVKDPGTQVADLEVVAVGGASQVRNAAPHARAVLRAAHDRAALQGAAKVAAAVYSGCDPSAALAEVVEAVTGRGAEGEAALAAARELAAGLPASTEQDPGAPFERSALSALRLLRRHDPAELQRALAGLKAGRKVNMTDLRKLLEDQAPLPDEEEVPGARTGPQYGEPGGRLVWFKDDQTLVPLGNFTARITAEVQEDDGAEVRLAKELRVQVAGRAPLTLARVPAERFSGLSWLDETPGAIPEPGQGLRDRIRHAVQVLSGDVPLRRVYAHLGWRELPGVGWAYLHAGGAIGAGGPVPGVEVRLQDSLCRFNLPAPGCGDALVAAVRASADLLYMGPPRLTAGLLGLVFRAPLGNCQSTAFLNGTTGVRKSSIAAVFQSHFGAEMSAKERLPGNWQTTANAQEALLFAAKDALVTVDDFVHTGTATDQAKKHGEADRIIRGVANQAGRQRMRADTSIRATRAPRALLLGTGEELPRGLSLRARMLVLQVDRGDVDLVALSARQELARQGAYAAAMSGFLRWLAPRFAAASAELQERVSQERKGLLSRSAHGQTAEHAGHAILGLRAFVDFALEVGAMEQDQADRWLADALGGIEEAVAGQAQAQEEADPVRKFCELLAGAISAGAAHVAGQGNRAPADAGAWGWRDSREGREEDDQEDWVPRPARPRTEWRAEGRRVGWVDEGSGEDAAGLWLLPAEAIEVARGRSGGELVVSERALGKMLRERGLLLSTDDARETVKVRVPARLERGRPGAWHLAVDFLGGINPTRVGFGARVPTSVSPTANGSSESLVGLVGFFGGRGEARGSAPAVGGA